MVWEVYLLSTPLFFIKDVDKYKQILSWIFKNSAVNFDNDCAEMDLSKKLVVQPIQIQIVTKII